MLFILVILAMKPTRGQRASTPRQETWCAALEGWSWGGGNRSWPSSEWWAKSQQTCFVLFSQPNSQWLIGIDGRRMIYSEYTEELNWLVVSNMNGLFSIYGMSSFPLTNSIIFFKLVMAPPTSSFFFGGHVNIMGLTAHSRITSKKHPIILKFKPLLSRE